MSEQTLRHRLNPTVGKGIALAGAGLFVLAVSEISKPLLRFVVTGALPVIGASDLWGHRRARDGAHGPVRAVLALAAGLGALVAPVRPFVLWS